MTTVLVTGANGFIGRHVCRAAARRGDRVFGLGLGGWDRESASEWGLSAWHDVEISIPNLEAASPPPDLIVHCAGGASVRFSIDNPAADFHTTVSTTLDVLEYIRTRVPHAVLVYPSSGAVYGRVPRLPATENSPRSPISPYGFHKAMAEDLCRSYATNFGISVAILRIFSAYGRELRKQLLWDACRKAAAGERRFDGTGEETRDWVHVEDVARLLLLAGAHADTSAPVVNCATGREVSVSSVLSVLFEAFGGGLRPSFSGITRSGDPERMAGDPARAAGWGWAPECSWDEGVRDYVAWFRGIQP